MIIMNKTTIVQLEETVFVAEKNVYGNNIHLDKFLVERAVSELIQQGFEICSAEDVAKLVEYSTPAGVSDSPYLVPETIHRLELGDYTDGYYITDARHDSSLNHLKGGGIKVNPLCYSTKDVIKLLKDEGRKDISEALQTGVYFLGKDFGRMCKLDFDNPKKGAFPVRNEQEKRDIDLLRSFTTFLFKDELELYLGEDENCFNIDFAYAPAVAIESQERWELPVNTSSYLAIGAYKRNESYLDATIHIGGVPCDGLSIAGKKVEWLPQKELI